MPAPNHQGLPDLIEQNGFKGPSLDSLNAGQNGTNIDNHPLPTPPDPRNPLDGYYAYPMRRNKMTFLTGVKADNGFYGYTTTGAAAFITLYYKDMPDVIVVDNAINDVLFEDARVIALSLSDQNAVLETKDYSGRVLLSALANTHRFQRFAFISFERQYSGYDPNSSAPLVRFNYIERRRQDGGNVPARGRP